MRVLNVLADDRVGGPQIRSRQIADSLRSDGVETLFVAPDGDGDFAEFARSAGFEVHTVPYQRLRSPNKLVENARYLSQFYQTSESIRALINSLSVDVAHVNVATNIQAAFGAARSDAGLLWHFNDTLTPTPVKQIAATAARRWADCLVVAADAVGRYYFSKSDTSCRTIYAPVDIDEFDPSTVDCSWPQGFLGRNSAPDCPVIGTVANINPAKGLEYFIRAVKMVRDQCGRVVAPIVGKRLSSQQEYEQKLHALIKKFNLTDDIALCGYRDDIAAVLSTFDVFVLSSVSEACPIAVLEAMAMETPIVATDVGGVREQITDGEHGFNVSPKDPTLLADRIVKFISEPGMGAKMGSRARARAMDRFSVSTISQQTKEAYHSTLETK